MFGLVRFGKVRLGDRPSWSFHKLTEIFRHFTKRLISQSGCNTYEILMSLIGREIEKHITENKTEKFEQGGFIKGGNILDNQFILRECVEETYRKKEQMVCNSDRL